MWSERRKCDKIGTKRYELFLPAVLYVKLVNFFILCETKHSDLINFPQVVFIFLPLIRIQNKALTYFIRQNSFMTFPLPFSFLSLF